MTAVVSKNFSNTVSSVDHSMPSTTYFTDVKIRKVALYALSTLLIAGSVGIITASAVGVVSWPLAFLAIPLMLAAAGLVHYAGTLKDYEDVFELQEMRKKAWNSSFSQIVAEHGLANVERYQIVYPEVLSDKFMKEYQFCSFSKLIQKYSLGVIGAHNLMPVEMLQKKFALEIQTMGVSNFFNAFSLSELSQHKIISGSQLVELNRLREQVQSAGSELCMAQAALDRKYPGRQEKLLKEVDREVFEAKERASRLKREMVSDVRDASHNSGYPFSTHRDWNEEMRFRNDRMINTEFEIIPAAERVADRILREELVAIQSKRQSIIDRGLGLADQEKYEKEISSLNKAHEVKIAGYAQKFQPIQQAILKAAKL